MPKELRKIFSLEDKIIVITGAAGLLGKKHAEAVAAYGGIPILIDLSKNAVENLADKLSKKYNAHVIGFEIDITDENQIKDNSELLFEKFGRVDGLVNNAANNPKVETGNNFLRLENFPIEVWNQDIAVGLTGAFLCAKHYGQKIALNSEGGSIVNISSDLGLIAPDQRIYMREGLTSDQQPVKPVTYSIIKTGIIGLTRYLATYWASNNVRCNALLPGGVKTDQDEVFIRKLENLIPLGHMAEKDEYQGTLVWMLSDAASYLNGAIISVDGGRTAW